MSEYGLRDLLSRRKPSYVAVTITRSQWLSAKEREVPIMENVDRAEGQGDDVILYCKPDYKSAILERVSRLRA